MSAHTPGKLVVRGGFSIYAADGKTPVADTCLTNSLPDNDEANARRLVACWNALDGLSQDALDGGWNFKDADAYTVRIERELDSSRAVNAELERQIAEAKRDAKLYAGMLVYGQEVVFPAGAKTTIDESLAAIDAKSAELNSTDLNSTDLDAWDCDDCSGTGSVTKLEAVTHQLGTDMMPFDVTCPTCDGLGQCGPDAEKRAAIASARKQENPHG